MFPWSNIIYCILLWGTWGITEKMALKHMSPFMVQLVSAEFAILIAPVLYFYIKSTNVPFIWNVQGVMWSSLTMILATLASISLLIALHKNDSGIIIGLTSIYPIITAILGIVFLGEDATIRKFFGIIIMFIGACVLSN